MQKLIVGLFILLLLAVALIYLFIPGKLPLSTTVNVKATPDGALRLLLHRGQWRHWWPGTVTTENGRTVLRYNGGEYRVVQDRFNGLDFAVQKGKNTLSTTMLFVAPAKDSLILGWQGELPTGSVPWQRWQRYRQGKDLEKDMAAVLQRFASFASKPENIYGRIIRQTKVKDTALVASRRTTVAYPTTEDIYGLVHKLRRYVQERGAKETGYPMLHVRRLSDTQYETMVALPVNRRLPQTETFLQKRMVPGNILVTEVRGGPAAVREAFAQLEQYVSDYRRQSPAMPFESLVTDRLQESDTTKWITRLYYPVF